MKTKPSLDLLAAGATREAMLADIPSRAFIQHAIDTGRFSREEDAVREALALWEERERRRIEIIPMIDEQRFVCTRQRTGVHEGVDTSLVDEIKQRLRRRIAADERADRHLVGARTSSQPAS